MPSDQPHDRLLRYAFSQRQVVLDYLNNFIDKKIVSHFDLRTIRLESGAYIDKDLKEFASDLEFSIEWKKKTRKKIEAKIYVLIEHKSYVPEFIHVQLLNYMTNKWMDDIKNKRPLTLVLPIVIYHGKKKWKYQQFSEYFKLPNEYFSEFIPKFEYLLTDLGDYSDDDITSLNVGYLMNTFLLLKHARDQEYVRQNIYTLLVSGVQPNIESGKNFVNVFSVYITKTTTFTRKELYQTVEDLPEKIKNIAMSTYDMLINEGKKEGEMESEMRIIASLIKKFPDFDDKEIAEAASVKISLVKKVRKQLDSKK